jgi:chromosome condensin MukBEF complex kleisin-like MukF subunit
MTVPPAVLFAPEPGMESSEVKERIHFRHSSTPVNEQFFSQENVDTVQDRIRAEVRGMVNANIDRQSDVDLKLVMRSYYLQYVGETVDQLNERVVAFCANRIAVEVEAYRYYRKDILDFPAPIQRPLDTQVYGTRTGELKSFF